MSDSALDLRPAELGIVVPLVACLLALSAWPAAISDNAIGTTLNAGPNSSARVNDRPPEGRMDFVVKNCGSGPGFDCLELELRSVSK